MTSFKIIRDEVIFDIKFEFFIDQSSPSLDGICSPKLQSQNAVMDDHSDSDSDSDSDTEDEIRTEVTGLKKNCSALTVNESSKHLFSNS